MHVPRTSSRASLGISALKSMMRSPSLITSTSEVQGQSRTGFALLDRRECAMKTSSLGQGRVAVVGSVKGPSTEPSGTIKMRRKLPF